MHLSYRPLNVHDTTLNNNPRTNNVCEGGNPRLYNLVGHHHPTVCKFIKGFSTGRGMLLH